MIADKQFVKSLLIKERLSWLDVSGNIMFQQSRCLSFPADHLSPSLIDICWTRNSLWSESKKRSIHTELFCISPVERKESHIQNTRLWCAYWWGARIAYVYDYLVCCRQTRIRYIYQHTELIDEKTGKRLLHGTSYLNFFERKKTDDTSHVDISRLSFQHIAIL